MFCSHTSDAVCVRTLRAQRAGVRFGIEGAGGGICPPHPHPADHDKLNALSFSQYVSIAIINELTLSHRSNVWLDTHVRTIGSQFSESLDSLLQVRVQKTNLCNLEM